MSRIRAFAKGQPCSVRLPAVCSFDPETTVLAHIKRLGHGSVGLKNKDIFGVHACNRCHDVIDGRTPFVQHGLEPDTLRSYVLDALIETQERLLKAGLLVGKGLV